MKRDTKFEAAVLADVFYHCEELRRDCLLGLFNLRYVLDRQ